MNQHYILYNPLAGNGSCMKKAESIQKIYPGAVLCDMRKIADYSDFFAGIEPQSNIVICGGDGTLNRFVNAVRDIKIHHNLYYCAAGTGNDFLRDLERSEEAEPTFRINKYLRSLPKVCVNGKEHLFINGVGYGIDGYCCEVGDSIKETSHKKVNYAAIAIKGLLRDYQPTNATVTVDGKTYTYKNVWLAPTMNGRYYGGGMKAAPNQYRRHKNKALSLVIMHDSGKLKTLCVFPSIFKGGHIKHKEMVVVLRGRDITVEFDRPAPLQIDGETIHNVTKYQARVS